MGGSYKVKMGFGLHIGWAIEVKILFSKNELILLRGLLVLSTKSMHRI
jgi:hypothetical protein